MKQSICIIAFSPINRDGRVLRQIKYLSPHYDLTVIGYGKPHPAWKEYPNTINWVPIKQASYSSLQARYDQAFLLLGRISWQFYLNWLLRNPPYIEALKHAVESRCNAFLANDWDTLPIAAQAAEKNHAPLVFDAHEYGPLQHEDRRRWRLFRSPAIKHILHKYSSSIDASITVSPMIAERYNQEFNLKPMVVLNAPDNVPLPVKELDPHAINLIHHGNALRGRRLEKMIETIALCDQRYNLHLMLIDEYQPDYKLYLKQLAGDLAPGQVKFYKPVAPEDVVSRISGFDMGFVLLEPNTYNHLAALPNKFFDFIVAGLGVCIGPSPAMMDVINEYGCGCVTPSFEPGDVANMLNQLTVDDVQSMQQAARTAAKKINAAHEMGKVVELCQRLL